ncbi:hypothetical protein NUW58_g3249 [Xylaria curta]|uniref:Uncharacterized protein n=1 Tax=Xylaria curta TaxID=42375 RepID=A0ACC1PE59_9PEZI|nr:hypothetical protein NUW58_g3249 [Xylaria curta]
MASRQAYAPTPHSYVPNTTLSATINLDEEVKLAETRAERDLQDSLAEIFSIIVTLDELERAFLKDAIPESDYTEICERSLKQYKSILGDETVANAFVGLEEFKAEWDLEVPRATERLKVGMPSTAVTASTGTAPQPAVTADSKSGQLILKATEDFITFLDALRLGLLAKDQLHPLLTDIIQSANKVTDQDFENRGKIIQWLITLNQMKATEELSEHQARELELDINSAVADKTTVCLSSAARTSLTLIRNFLIENMQRTFLAFQHNAKLHSLQTVVRAVRSVASLEEANKSLFKGATEEDHVVVTEKTIFHPQGGGQPSDVGVIRAASGVTFAVSAARMNAITEGEVLHLGRFTDPSSHFESGDDVTQTIDAEKRNLYSRYHTAGHVLGAAVRHLLENEVANFDELKASHFPDSASCEFQGLIEGKWKDSIQARLDEYINKDMPVEIDFWDEDDFRANGLERLIPDRKAMGMADDEKFRVVKIIGAESLWLFFYSCFLKPHAADGKDNQQGALESFYKSQAGAYDATRKGLLRGREDMLALAAAQLTLKAKEGESNKTKRIWVDIGGGTGWNIEAMSQFVDVPTFFDSVYLVDFSPSLCEVARKRFARLGWTNVKIVCQDARKFRLEDHEPVLQSGRPRSPEASYFSQGQPRHVGADLITMSYSLSMIPDYYSVVDSLPSLLAPNGILGVVDFYVQSRVDVSFRNYTGGMIDRHVNFIGRTFWRAWFDIDRVALEPGRRDYLEYRFGTVLNVNTRNYALGAIPYYIWLGARKQPHSSSLSHEIVEKVNALVTESPYLSPTNHSDMLSQAVERGVPEIRSKAFDAAIVNISSNLPLPSFFYQNHHYRIYYDDQLKKHTQFNDEYIYAFTWEDTRVDERILKLKSDDVVLAITSAGDNILSYALQGPARIHAVDLNPSQNHLLELKIAAYQSLEYGDLWKIFGEGKHPDFRSLLISKMSPHLSSRAFQYWLSNHRIFTKSKGGLYDTGGSKHGIRIFRWITQVFGCRAAVKDLLNAKTLNEQREIWRKRVRPALLSRLVSKFVVSQESFLWTALGVPKNQLAILEADHAVSDAVCGPELSSPKPCRWDWQSGLPSGLLTTGLWDRYAAADRA